MTGVQTCALPISEFDYNAQIAYMAQIQAGSIDIMVMPEKLYQTLKKNEPFADLKELMGEEAFEKSGMQTDTTHISITDSELCLLYTSFGWLSSSSAASTAVHAAQWITASTFASLMTFSTEALSEMCIRDSSCSCSGSTCGCICTCEYNCGKG